MYVESINIGARGTLAIGNDIVETGIFKQPVPGPVPITREQVGDDLISNLRAHGGPDQVVYIYGGADYAWWSATLGFALEPGRFGDNLTIAELESGPLRIGDRLAAGSVLLEITSPRIPCAKLAARMEDADFIKRFMAAQRPGLYCRVIEPGALSPGDPVTLLPYGGKSVTTQELFCAYHDNELTETTLQTILSTPLAVRMRRRFAEKLRKAQKS